MDEMKQVTETPFFKGILGAILAFFSGGVILKLLGHNYLERNREDHNKHEAAIEKLREDLTRSNDSLRKELSHIHHNLSRRTDSLSREMAVLENKFGKQQSDTNTAHERIRAIQKDLTTVIATKLPPKTLKKVRRVLKKTRKRTKR